MRMFAFALMTWLMGLAAGGSAFAQSSATGGPTPSPPGAEEYFVDLKDGATIGTKTTIHFGLRGMGVAPAGSNKPNTGHHHLLIDTDLPPLDQPIPNDFNHLHFGAGQTEVDLTLTPGPHTLQLLLGDGNHIPHTPPVMSQRIHVNVVETPPPAAAEVATAPAAPPAVAAPQPTPPAAAPQPAPAAPQGLPRSPSAPGARVFIISPKDGATVPLTVQVRFGVANMTIVPAGVEQPYSGHHHLLIDTPLPPLDEPIPSDENHLHFGKGQTETTITLTPGTHTLQLLLGDANHVPHNPPVFSAPITVTASDVAPRRACRASEIVNSRGECEPRQAERTTRPSAARRRAVPPSPRAASRRLRQEEGGSPAAGPAAPQADPGFTDFRRCQPGMHSESFPSSQGWRCVLNQ